MKSFPLSKKGCFMYMKMLDPFFSTFLYIGFIFDFEYFMKSNFLGHSQAIFYKDLFYTTFIIYNISERKLSYNFAQTVISITF